MQFIQGGKVLQINKILYSAKLLLGKTWANLVNWMPFADILPNQIYLHFCKTLDYQIKVCMCVSRDLRCKLGYKDVNLEISSSLSWNRSKIWSFRPIIFIYMITLKGTFYWKLVHCYWSHDDSNYWSWVSVSLNTNRFSELMKDNLPSDLL